MRHPFLDCNQIYPSDGRKSDFVLFFLSGLIVAEICLRYFALQNKLLVLSKTEDSIGLLVAVENCMENCLDWIEELVSQLRKTFLTSDKQALMNINMSIANLWQY